MNARSPFPYEEPDREDGFPVALPSGAVFWVLSEAEVSYVEDRRDRYLSDNHFVNISDLQDVDRMLISEMLILRWTQWVSRGKDFWGDPIDEQAFRRSINDYASELRQLKKALGVDKGTRDKTRGEDSTATYIETLRARAKEFGYHRNNQAAKAMELFNQMHEKVVLLDNTTPDEQAELDITPAAFIKWVREVCIPEYEALDHAFRNREDGQRYWVRSM